MFLDFYLLFYWICFDIGFVEVDDFLIVVLVVVDVVV